MKFVYSKIKPFLASGARYWFLFSTFPFVATITAGFIHNNSNSNSNNNKYIYNPIYILLYNNYLIYVKVIFLLEVDNLMKRMAKKGFTVNNIVIVIVAIIMLIAVAIPVTSDVIDSANLSGTTATVVGLLPLLLAVGGVVVVTALYRGG